MNAIKTATIIIHGVCILFALGLGRFFEFLYRSVLSITIFPFGFSLASNPIVHICLGVVVPFAIFRLQRSKRIKEMVLCSYALVLGDIIWIVFTTGILVSPLMSITISMGN